MPISFQSITRNCQLLFLSSICLFLAACSSSNDSLPRTLNQQTQASSQPVNGNAVKGVIENGIVSAYQISTETDDSESRQLITQTRTSSSGKFNLDIPEQYQDSVILLELTADSHSSMRCDLVKGCDSADGGSKIGFGGQVPLPDDFAMLGTLDPDTGSAFISPLSHIVVSTARSIPGGLSTENITIASEWLEQAFDLDQNVLSIETPDLTALLAIDEASDQQLKQGVLNASFYSLVYTEAWNNGELILDALPLDTIFYQAAELAQQLSEQLTDSSVMYANSLSAISEYARNNYSIVASNPIDITEQPASVSVDEGSSFTLSVQVTGDGPVAYQWRLNGINIPGANAASYEISEALPEHTGIYNVLVSNSIDSLQSLSALVTVNEAIEPVVITQQPQSQTLTEGDSFSLSVSASGDAPFTYQWQKNGVTLAGATNSTYTISNSAVSDQGSYRVTVTNAAGSVQSLSALVTINEAIEPVVITQQPQSQTLTEGDSFSLSVAVSGDGPFTYQWQKGGSLIPGANTSSYFINTCSLSDQGSYRAIVSNSVSSANSAFAELIVTEQIDPVVITTQPQARIVTEGDSASFSVEATGGGFISYQWFKDGNTINNAYASTLTIETSAMDDAGSYSVTVANSQGSQQSAAASLTVLAPQIPVSISAQPQPGSLYIGDAITLSVVASGDGALLYQWFLDGREILNANQASYTISSASYTDSGIYTVSVSNEHSAEVSQPALVSVIERPAIELSWDIPTEREDGSVLELYEIAGYVIEYGNSAENLTGRISISDGASSEYLLTDQAPGTLYLRIATLDTDGLLGNFSEPISVVIADN